MKEAELALHVKNALEYPGVNQDTFRASFVFSRVNGNDAFPEVDARSIGMAVDGSVRLAGAVRDVPTYSVTLTDGDGHTRTLKNRVALVGYGSNSSKGVLAQKFNNFAQAAERGLDICVLSASIDNHAVVHGAFLGVRGPVPATLHAHQGTRSTITVGLYDREAAEHMTGTEPNYDGVMLAQSARLATGVEIPNPLAYVAVWGAMSGAILGAPAKDPVALEAIPAKTSLLQTSSLSMLQTVAARTGGSAADIDAYIRTSVTDEDRRLDRIETLQSLYKLAPNVRGSRVFPSTIAARPRAASILARYPGA